MDWMKRRKQRGVVSGAAPPRVGRRGAAMLRQARHGGERLAAGGLIAVYPEELYSFLLEVAKARDLAVDAATGMGWAALPLAYHFDRVYAVDKEPRVLRKAVVRERLHYLAAAAESLPLPSNCVDLLTVAQALHQLDLDRFTLKPSAFCALAA